MDNLEEESSKIGDEANVEETTGGATEELGTSGGIGAAAGSNLASKRGWKVEETTGN